MDIKLAVFRPASASTQIPFGLETLASTFHHTFSSMEEKPARFLRRASFFPMPFISRQCSPRLKQKGRAREREREWGGWAGETADAVITLDICNTFFCWSEAAIFPETRWRHYNTKVEWLHLTDREVQEWGVKARYCYSELFSPLTFMYSNICILVWSWIHKYIWILCILKYLTVKCNLFVCVCVCVCACVRVRVCPWEEKKNGIILFYLLLWKRPTSLIEKIYQNYMNNCLKNMMIWIMHELFDFSRFSSVNSFKTAKIIFNLFH